MKNNLSSYNEYLINEKNIDERASVIQEVILPKAGSKVKVFLKRDDLIHPVISGNKWRKLKYNIKKVLDSKTHRILTFGGAFSNHIHATAYAGKIFKIETIGIIRGEKHLPLNPTLDFVKKCGMEINYISRSDYRKRKEPEFVETLKAKFGEFHLIPEGGTNELAVKGCTEIINQINIDYDYIASACGTGGTLSGLICGTNGNKKVIGIPVLKNAGFLNEEIKTLTQSFSNKIFDNWELLLDYHFGGYAKINTELINFINQFENINQIRLDPIYTGKLLCGINNLIEKNYFSKGSRIILLHTGGLQGNMGMEAKVKKLVSNN